MYETGIKSILTKINVRKEKPVPGNILKIILMVENWKKNPIKKEINSL